jgi:prevent-host-death family protein
MKMVSLSVLRASLSNVLRLAAKEEVLITRRGNPAGVLIGFKSEDDWFEYRLQNDPRFLKRVEAARKSMKAGQGTRIEDLDK